jgi:hypothetical protein
MRSHLSDVLARQALVSAAMRLREVLSRASVSVDVAKITIRRNVRSFVLAPCIADDACLNLANSVRISAPDPGMLQVAPQGGEMIGQDPLCGRRSVIVDLPRLLQHAFRSHAAPKFVSSHSWWLYSLISISASILIRGKHRTFA